MKTSLELALNFLANRNPFDDVEHTNYVFMLMDFQDKKGNEAIEALAGFYLHAIKKIGGQKGSDAILETFSHDLYGANDKWLEPRSADYREVWLKEINEYVISGGN